ATHALSASEVASSRRTTIIYPAPRRFRGIPPKLCNQPLLFKCPDHPTARSPNRREREPQKSHQACHPEDGRAPVRTHQHGKPGRRILGWFQEKSGAPHLRSNNLGSL